MPSPALIIFAVVQSLLARVYAAPLDGCLIMSASAPSASSVWAVSFKFSPFETALVSAEKLMTSALNLFAANSKLIRVLVEFSKNKVTTVFPCRVGNFREDSELSLDISAALSSRAMACGPSS